MGAQRDTAQDDPSIGDADRDSGSRYDELDTGVAIASGAVFLTSGAALVLHIVLRVPLAGAVAVILAVGSLVAARALATDEAAADRWRTRVRVGAGVGVVATIVYDLSRWVLVWTTSMTANPFEALPLFGQALIGDRPGSLAAGVAFHAVNGIAFGIAYTIWMGRRGPVAGVAFAFVLEAAMLAVYPGWLDPRSIAELTSISLLGHVAYGLALGYGSRAALGRVETEEVRA